MNLKQVISRQLNVPTELIEKIVLLAPTHVKKFTIPKKAGGTRAILQPSIQTKMIQYWLIHNIFNKLPVHSAALAYRKGISIADNAEAHRVNRFFVKIDLKDFFPSIHFKDLTKILGAWHKTEKPEWELDGESLALIRNCCFYKAGFLPIGYPSSPAISNAVMYEFDLQLSSLLSDKSKYGETIYTRYADDIVISTDKKGISHQIIEAVSKHITSSSSPKISINPSKTKVGSSTGGSAQVTGLKICEKGQVTIHRKQKDHIRLLLSLYRKGVLDETDQKKLQGHLSYIHHVDPSFYSKLSMKYFIEMDRIKKGEFATLEMMLKAATTAAA